jgi:hypothetical protein
MGPTNSTARSSKLVTDVEVMPCGSPLCDDETFLHYVRLQASRVRAALRRDEDLAAGLRVLVRPRMSGSESAVVVEILGRSPDGERLASDFDPHPYLAVRGAFDRLLVHRLRAPPTSAPAEAEPRWRRRPGPGELMRSRLAEASRARRHPAPSQHMGATEAGCRACLDGGKT